MRSSTARPAPLRAFCTAWTISRARPAAAQRVVERQVERDGVRALALELVALERLHREQQVVGAEVVVVTPSIVMPTGRAVAQRRGRRAPASSAATAAATCGMPLPKRGPSVR